MRNKQPNKKKRNQEKKNAVLPVPNARPYHPWRREPKAQACSSTPASHLEVSARHSFLAEPYFHFSRIALTQTTATRRIPSQVFFKAQKLKKRKSSSWLKNRNPQENADSARQSGHRREPTAGQDEQHRQNEGGVQGVAAALRQQMVRGAKAHKNAQTEPNRAT